MKARTLPNVVEASEEEKLFRLGLQTEIHRKTLLQLTTRIVSRKLEDDIQREIQQLRSMLEPGQSRRANKYQLRRVATEQVIIGIFRSNGGNVL